MQTTTPRQRRRQPQTNRSWPGRHAMGRGGARDSRYPLAPQTELALGSPVEPGTELAGERGDHVCAQGPVVAEQRAQAPGE